MRAIWLSVLFFSSFATAGEQGLWGIKDPATGYYIARLIAIEKDSDLVFHYFTEGRFHCEVPGVAKPVRDSYGRTNNVDGRKYIFKNDKEYWLHQEGYEGYFSPEDVSSCSIEFTFKGNHYCPTRLGAEALMACVL